MKTNLASPKGTTDLFGEEIAKREYLRAKLYKYAELFGFSEIETPSFENAELFCRAVGETTDIVSKEMYTFSRTEKETFALKPEGTSPVIRAYLQNGLSNLPQPVKLCYISGFYRAEKPQKGRLRQFNQFGCELIGSPSPLADAEIIALADFCLKNLGIKNVELRINSVGCPSCRKAYYEKLKQYISENNITLCDECKTRLIKNPMRIFDCKNEQCISALVGAPVMKDNLCEDCREHFSSVQKALDAYGVKYTIDPKIVRGLDYYVNTAFEFVSSDLGSQSTVCGGGRYDGLFNQLGGSDNYAVGFGMGIERLTLIMESQNLFPEMKNECDLYIASIGEEGEKTAITLANSLRTAGVRVQTDLNRRSLKAQLKFSDKLNSRFTAIIGENELNEGKLVLRDMKTGEQYDIETDSATEKLLELIK